MEHNSLKTIPFFSIIIVNYNHGKFLEEAIQSILNQDEKDYELILVDGASTDNSLEVIKKYTPYFSWWISEKDNGQSEAFNKGFSHAKGQYFFWLNADDLLLEGALNKAKNYLTQNKDCKWLAGNTITFDVNRNIKWCIRGPIFIEYLVRHGTVYVYGPTSIFHRDLWFEAGGFDENLHYTMDTDLWYRFLNMGYKFKRLRHYCWGFRIHEESKTSHEFSGKPELNFIAEKQYIQIKNNHKIKKSVEIFVFGLKIITGCFLMKLADNLSKSGKKI
jgi:glycosyltransferase involved in cell wall biosynthesis